MRRTHQRTLWLAALAAGQLFFVDRPAMAESGKPAPPRPESPVPAPPELPAPRSPVSIFRELLAMTPVERRQFLSKRPPENQRLILAKIREYEALKPNQRELRLKVTELRWYLLPLMSMPATNRTALLASIPEEDRKLVADRLAEWDKLAPPQQKALLDNEVYLRFLTDLEAGEQRGTTNSIQAGGTPPKGVQQWQQLSEPERRRLKGLFIQYFQLNADEQEKVLETISEPERRQIEKTLAKYGQLSFEQRAQCMRSFERFASLSPAERQQFLKNAARWKRMPADERKTWVDLVNKVASQPPLPPGLNPFPTPPLPPLPPEIRPGSLPPRPPPNPSPASSLAKTNRSD